ncbi:hypothetical protein CF319_g2147 [Tilletia indica]|nr:hypothetical protein CF319_g2147 [Tilletia indica]
MHVSLLLTALFVERAIGYAVYPPPSAFQIHTQNLVHDSLMNVAPRPHKTYHIIPLSQRALQTRAGIEWPGFKEAAKTGGIILGGTGLSTGVGFLLGWASTAFGTD